MHGRANIVFIGGNHPRHLYYANAIQEGFGLTAAVIQDRGDLYPTAPLSVSDHDRDNWVRHFARRQVAESEYFGDQSHPSVSTLYVDKGTLNSETTANWVKKWHPDIVMIFGCGMIRPPLFDVMPRYAVNLHLGLSPRYRGAATLFWPFYFLEPQMAGCTFHQIVDEPDAGMIYHQSVPTLATGDGIHDAGAKAVLQATEDAIELLHIWPDWKEHKQKNTGKCFLASDFKPQHLRAIYDLYDNKIVDEHLYGRLPNSPYPNLVRSFV